MKSKPAFRLDVFAVQKLIVGFLVLLLVFFVGYGFGINGYASQNPLGRSVVIDRSDQDGHDEINFSLFWKVWDTLSASYFNQGKIIPEEMVYGAIKGMVSSVGDPYTVFLTPKQNKVVQEDLQGSFEGVGIQIGYIDFQLAVVAPLPDSPAQEAGIEAGDLILKIKDDSEDVDIETIGMSLPDAVNLIRGEAGSVITLTILRNGDAEPRDIDIVRSSIDLPSVILDFVGEDNSIAHIQIIKFSGETKAEWEDKLREILKTPNLDGVILDVRNNPGGYLQGAVDLASEFLEIGEVVVIEQSNKDKVEYKVEMFGRLKDVDVVVLVNKGSASASEILAGALRDQLGALLVGEKTFGKGTIQEPLQLEDGEGLHMTIAKWLTPRGIWVNDEEGLTPDVLVEDNPDTESDEQLQRAIEELSRG